MTWFFYNESVPVISILNESDSQLFETAAIMAVQVSPSKTYSEHTLENGEVVTDNVIDNRTAASVQLTLNPDDYEDVYNDIKSIYASNSTITIVTRVDIYRNMYIQSLPHEETPSKSNTIDVYLDLIEQQIVETSIDKLSASDVANPSNQSTVASGQKTGTTSSKSALAELSDFVTGG